MDDSSLEIHRSGHRFFVGGDGEFWDRIGALQFQFLLEQGVTPSDRLFDIGCGSLRGGSRFIRHLNRGCYFGIDKHIELIIYGVAEELGLDDFRRKQPRFVISDAFEFGKFEATADVAIAQSLFTHLTESDIDLCFSNLRASTAHGCRFFTTFFESKTLRANRDVSHSHAAFSYTRAQMEDFGVRNRWTPRYIGDWSHPRNQKMMQYSVA